MIQTILNLFRGCQHKRYTFPQTNRLGRTHVACVECGKEFAYDWQAMRRLGPVNAPEALVPCPVTAARREA
jgi:hypothetical protein